MSSDHRRIDLHKADQRKVDHRRVEQGHKAVKKGAARAPSGLRASSERPAVRAIPNPAVIAELSGRVLYRDTSLIVIDKPAGLAVHAGPQTPLSLENYLSLFRFGLGHDPIPAHRLDRDTSGCLLLARNDRARRRLGQLFTEHAVHKIYWAIVDGAPPNSDGTLAMKLAKRNTRQGWRMVIDPQGAEAETQYRVLATTGVRSLLELKPLTGRTHQIRVHCAAAGYPVRGDPIYGRSLAGQPHLLHARHLTFQYRPEDAALSITAPIPAHFEAELRSARLTIP